MHLQWNGWKGSRVRAIGRDSRCAVCVADRLAKKKKRKKKKKSFRHRGGKLGNLPVCLTATFSLIKSHSEIIYSGNMVDWWVSPQFYLAKKAGSQTKPAPVARSPVLATL